MTKSSRLVLDHWSLRREGLWLMEHENSFYEEVNCRSIQRETNKKTVTWVAECQITYREKILKEAFTPITRIYPRDPWHSATLPQNILSLYLIFAKLLLGLRCDPAGCANCQSLINYQHMSSYSSRRSCSSTDNSQWGDIPVIRK